MSAPPFTTFGAGPGGPLDGCQAANAAAAAAQANGLAASAAQQAAAAQAQQNSGSPGGGGGGGPPRKGVSPAAVVAAQQQAVALAQQQANDINGLKGQTVVRIFILSYSIVLFRITDFGVEQFCGKLLIFLFTRHKL